MMEEETRCTRCKGLCKRKRNIEVCVVCGWTTLHFEGGLPDIIEALDFFAGDGGPPLDVVG